MRSSAKSILSPPIYPDPVPESEARHSHGAHIHLSSVTGGILKNFAALSAGRFVSQIIGFVTSAYLARRIAPQGFGAISLAQAAMAYLNILSDSGLATISIREAAQNPQRLQTIISNISGLRVFVAFVCMVAGLVAAPFLPYSQSSRHLLAVFALSLPLQALAVDWVFRAIQRMQYMAIVQAVTSALTLILTIVFIEAPPDVRRVPLISLVTSAAAAILSILFLRRCNYRPEFRWCPGVYRRYLAEAAPFCASALAITLYTQVNYLILGKLHTEAVVGLYSAAAKLTVLVTLLSSLYYAAMSPAFMALYKSSEGAALRLFSHSVRLTAAMGLGLLLTTICSRSSLVAAIYGSAFHQGNATLAVLLSSAAVATISQNYVQLAISARQERLILRSTVMGGCVNLLACGLLAPSLGALGAALATLMAEAAVIAALHCPWPKEVRASAIQSLAKPGGAFISAVIVSAALSSCPAVVSVPASVLVYLGALLALGGLTRADAVNLRAALLRGATM
ncbi:MAG: flippase [Acidobacteriia bacterium]|nr:flippase [Terriglobia bacterium]